MKAGLHVMTEKLMGHSVHECKEMARVAQQTNLLLATGHQRHYNILYDDSVELIRKGLLGELHHIRAQWHRGNLPGNDSWQQPMPRAAKPDDPQADRLDKDAARSRSAEAEAEPKEHEGASRPAEWEKKVAAGPRPDRGRVVEAAKFGYEDLEIKDAAGNVVYRRPAIEELIRWRLWDRTGAGLMAELGSHQLDAAGIFIAAAHGGKKQHPLSVAASSARPLFPPDRDVEDHVYCIIEFPAPGYDPKDPAAKPQEDRRPIRLDQRQRLRRLRRDGLRHRGDAAAGDRKGGHALQDPRHHEQDQGGGGQGGRQDRRRGAAGRRGGRPGVGGHRHARDAAGRTRLHRGVGALGVVHPQPLAGEPAPLSSQGGPGRRGDRPDDQHGRPAGRPDRVQGAVVRRRERRDAGGRQAGRTRYK